MNKQLEDYARQTLKDGLAKLPENNRVLFKRMYALHGNIELPIYEVVDKMEVEKLDWAIQQVSRSIEKLAK